jgi:CDP-diacylglycerol--glycerol-3-phosphate 3-phosphatidyltransferase
LGNYKVVLIVLILAYITDAIDGFVARQFNQVSDWGKVFDPLGDKVLSASVSLLLLQKGILDLYFVVLVILRDFLISVFSVKKIKNEKFVFRAVFVGKLLTFLLAILYSLSVLNLMNSVSLSVVKILEIVCLIFVLISGTYYLMIYLKNDKNVNQ